MAWLRRVGQIRVESKEASRRRREGLCTSNHRRREAEAEAEEEEGEEEEEKEEETEVFNSEQGENLIRNSHPLAPLLDRR